MTYRPLNLVHASSKKVIKLIIIYFLLVAKGLCLFQTAFWKSSLVLNKRRLLLFLLLLMLFLSKFSCFEFSKTLSASTPDIADMTFHLKHTCIFYKMLRRFRWASQNAMLNEIVHFLIMSVLFETPQNFLCDVISVKFLQHEHTWFEAHSFTVSHSSILPTWAQSKHNGPRMLPLWKPENNTWGGIARICFIKCADSTA